MLFKLENNLLVLDKDSLRGVPEFKKILERDRGSEGDSQGRLKLRAWKEFYYIYYIADFRSNGNLAGFNDKELHLRGVKEADLEATFKPDDDIRKAIEVYKQTLLEITPSYTLLTELIRGIRLSEKVVKSMILGVEKVLELNELTLAAEGEINIAMLLTNNSALEAQLKSFTKISTEFPKTLDMLKMMLEKVLKEEADTRVGRGGKAIGNRADPVK